MVRQRTGKRKIGTSGINKQRWLEFLLKDEFAFNSEIHLLGSGEKPVDCLPEDGVESGCGWFLTFSDTEAGEWNLARPFGESEEYLKILTQFPPKVPFHLLVPLSDADTTLKKRGLIKSENLIWHRSVGESTEIPFLELDDKKEEFLFSETTGELRLKFLEEEPGDLYKWKLKGYLLKDDSIVSLVKTVHATPESVEVYIETIPGRRDLGLGTQLLKEFAKRVHNAGRTLIYVVSEENSPSLKVAAKVGLKPYMTLARIPFCNGHR